MKALFASLQVSDAVGIALRDLWGSNPQKIPIPFAAIQFVLVRLGANPAILEELGWITERAQKNHISNETLLNALKRLLAIVKTAGSSVEFVLNWIVLLMEYTLVLAHSLQMTSQMWC